ncbi:caspase-3 isoform X2 [Ixodes scapularis]|uniref:caspase-3 isoform X2 n=1 Tax=Ixodes scapularis TaxID=6945 RepID=UPI001A9D62DA|nr:caspase-3 isoform X2 [Ixodes scapularis]
MDPEHKRKLKDPDIIARLVPIIDFNVLAPRLVNKRVLTIPMVEDILENSEDERTFRLLQRLPKRGPLAYERTLEALKETGMMKAFEVLTGQAPQRREGPLQSHGNGTAGEHGDAELKVRRAEEWKDGDDVYRMMRRPRGTCVIINNRDFHNNVLAQRRGSELDVQRMRMLFQELDFVCIIRLNQTKEEMTSLLSHVASQQRRNVDCLVVILMSHGSAADIIYDVNADCVNTEELIALFNNDNCPALQDKPKLFFIQACRGDKHDGGTSCVMDTADAASLSADMASVKLCASRRNERAPTVSDMFVAYPTIKGHVSLKNEVSGSWFLSTVFLVFSEHAWNAHLDKMMRRVADEVHKRVSHDGGRQTINIDVRGWRKKLYFNPGLALEQMAS